MQQIRVKFFDSFRQQLIFVVSVLEAANIAILFGSSALPNATIILNLIFNLLAVVVITFYLCMNLLKLSSKLHLIHQWESRAYYGVGVALIVIGIIVLIIAAAIRDFNGNRIANVSSILQIVVLGPLFILIGWQHGNMGSSAEESLNPIFISFSVGRNPIRYVEDVLLPGQSHHAPDKILISSSPLLSENADTQIKAPPREKKDKSGGNESGTLTSKSLENIRKLPETTI